MRRHVFVLAFMTLTPHLVSCMRSVEDTDGHRFNIECSQSPCRLLLDKPDDAGVSASYSLRSEGRLLLACAPEQSELNCRPISCKTSDSCSTLGGSAFSCAGAYCENKAHDMLAADRLAVCLATMGPWTGTPEQRTRLSLIHAAPDTDDLPAACR